MDAEKRLQELHLDLLPPKPMAVYKPVVQIGNTLSSPATSLCSTMAATSKESRRHLTLEQGKQAARQVGLAMLATLRPTRLAQQNHV